MNKEANIVAGFSLKEFGIRDIEIVPTFSLLLLASNTVGYKGVGAAVKKKIPVNKSPCAASHQSQNESGWESKF